jgi:glutamine phosphoribosylpyrophosphate amidotransferase
VDDAAGREEVGAEVTRSLLVHLRRPSKLSTIGPADTQPFDDPAGRYSFSHNGELANELRFRKQYQEAGRLRGRADTEVGARWLEDEWNGGTDVPGLLARLHRTFEGDENLAVLTRDGTGYHYAGNSLNPVFTFELGPIRLASTGLHSLDRSFFKYVAPEATNRRLVPRSSTATI